MKATQEFNLVVLHILNIDVITSEHFLFSGNFSLCEEFGWAVTEVFAFSGALQFNHFPILNRLFFTFTYYWNFSDCFQFSHVELVFWKPSASVTSVMIICNWIGNTWINFIVVRIKLPSKSCLTEFLFRVHFNNGYSYLVSFFSSILFDACPSLCNSFLC